MKIIVLIVFVILLVGGIIVLYKAYYIHPKLRKLVAKKYDIMSPLLRKLKSRVAVTTEEVMMLSRDPSLRYAVFRILEAYDRTDLFPAEYLTQEKAAESVLVNWLEFPTELGAVPKEIALFAKISIEQEELMDYYVFRFRAPPSHPVGEDWMLGVCGPYQQDTHPYDMPLRVFSRFNVAGSISPEEEVHWVHKNINQKA
jgi:hypothetical protein